jgi:hypothetical protein
MPERFNPASRSVGGKLDSGLPDCVATSLFPSPWMGEGQGEGERSDGIIFNCPSTTPSPTRVEGVTTQSVLRNDDAGAPVR